ncbi:MAG: hypothetical protein RLZZ362_2131, partial [Actinomycetota bacterium]
MSATIDLVGLSKSFGTLEVVRSLDLHVEAGSFVSIVGPSGCGKSTLLRMVAGLEQASSGAGTIGGAAPVALLRAKQLAMVPQQPGLLPWRTVGANASLLLDIDPARNPASHPDP